MVRFRSQQSHTGLGAASGSASLCAIFIQPHRQETVQKKVIVLFAQDGPRFVFRSQALYIDNLKQSES